MKLSGSLIFVLLFCICKVKAFNLYDTTIFRLYKNEVLTTYTLLNKNTSVKNELFDPKIPTKIFIHGFLAKEETIETYHRNFRQIGDFNFIAIDWTKGASTLNYIIAKTRIELIAERLAEMIDGLVLKGMNLKNLTIIGHSLGAHMAGLAAKRVKSGKVGFIVALDPAGVGFSVQYKENRLDKSNADYVQVIHTDIDKFGIAEPIGHADFYPNFGRNQPGCPSKTLLNYFDKCSHCRSHELFWQSLTSNFTAIKCASFDEIQQNRCTFDKTTEFMGGDVASNTNRPYGVFYLETTESSPFVISNYKMFKNIQLVD